MFHKMPLILITLITIVFLLNPFISFENKQILYAISLTTKSFIITLLPFIIFGLLLNTTSSLSRRATTIIGMILLCVCCSNAISTFLSHYVGEWIYHFDLGLLTPTKTHTLTPAWSWQFPQIVSNDKAMFIGIAIGFVLSWFEVKWTEQVIKSIQYSVSKLLVVVTYLIPVFVIGFVLKLQYDGVIYTIVKNYTLIFLVVAVAQFSYILFIYAGLANFHLHPFMTSIKTMFPAALGGFSSMSSAAVMPLTIAGVERNATHKHLVCSIVPATVNIHLLGDCIAIPIFAYAVMKSFGIAEPSLITYLIFVFYFVIAKFSVAAVPGGGIIVMLPVLQNRLGFNGEMLSLITALYILFDPIITSVNVLGNGALAKLIDKLYSIFFTTSYKRQALKNT